MHILRNSKDIDIDNYQFLGLIAKIGEYAWGMYKFTNQTPSIPGGGKDITL